MRGTLGRSSLANVVAFQLCWLGSVSGAAAGWPWVGPLIVGIWVALHVVYVAPHSKSEAQFIVGTALAGWIADSLLVTAGYLLFPPHAALGVPSAIWMAALWAGFAATIPHSLRWLDRHLGLAAGLGAIAGPLAYLGGERLGAITLSSSEAFLGVAVVYAVITPALVATWRRLAANQPEPGVVRP